MSRLTATEKDLQKRFAPYVCIEPASSERGILIKWPSGKAIAAQEGLDSDYTVHVFSIRKGSYDIFRVPASNLAGVIDSLIQPSVTGQISDLLDEALARKPLVDFQSLNVLVSTQDRIAFLVNSQRVELRRNKEQTHFALLQSPAGESPFLPKSKQVFTSRDNVVTALTRLLD